MIAVRLITLVMGKIS